MRNIKLVIEFDGTNYSGWQIQNDQVTVQGVIEEAIKVVTKDHQVKINGSSRTDSGVHAVGMVANFNTNSTIPAEKFRDAINTKLPDDIAIVKSEEVALDFHPRYCCLGKTYSYTIINRVEKVALRKNYAYHVKQELNIENMKEACKYFIGTHDFKAFRSQGSSVKTTVRNIKELYIVKNGQEIKIYITADGFLYNMVRNIVGTLIYVGTGKIKPEDIVTIINSKDRSKAGTCVPPNGLVLEKVYY